MKYINFVEKIKDYKSIINVFKSSFLLTSDRSFETEIQIWLRILKPLKVRIQYLLQDFPLVI